MEDSTLSVKERLSSDFRRLNKYFVVPQIILLLALLVLFPFIDSFSYLSILTLSFLTIRLFLNRLAQRCEACPIFLNFISLALIGLGWGGIFVGLLSGDQFYDSSSFFLLAIVFILMGLSASTLSSSFRTGFLFLSLITAYPLYHLLIDVKAYEVGFLLVGNYIFQVWRIYDRNKELKKSYNDQLKTHSSNLFLNDVLDVIPGLFLIVDEEGVYRFVNNFKDGFFKKEILNKSLGCFDPNGEFLKSLKEFRNSSLNESISEVSSSFFGDEEFFMVHFRRIESPVKGIAVVVLPTTELVLAKNSLKIHEARSEFSSKLVSLGEFSANIAHEINNPLTIIEGSVNLTKILLNEEHLDKHAIEKAADKIMMTTQRIARIIKSLRTLSGNVKEEPFTDVHFMDIIEPTLEITKSKLHEHNIELRVLPVPEEVAFYGNEIQLSQVVMNLVSNSIDAIKDSPDKKWIELEFRPSVVWLDIFVRDSGRGISDEIAEKIMEPFFTTKSSSQGTGLGLSISKNILVAHGATLNLLKDGPHTTFRVRFPRMKNKS